VIALLNRYFVPVHIAMDDYDFKGGTAPAAEKEAFQRIAKKAMEGKPVLLPPDAYCYVVAPDGQPIAGMGLPEMIQLERMTAMLEQAVRNLKTAGGQSLVKSAPLSAPPPTRPDALTLHVVARYLSPKGSWGQLPGEDWIVLERADWTKLLGSDRATVDTGWDIDKEVVAKLLTHFYPPTPSTNVANNHFEEQSLRATLMSVRDGVARARIEGKLRMRHHFLPRKDHHAVEATLVGFLEYEPEGKKIRSVQLVTDKATYAGGDFGVALRSVP
jgi:hypothetical protein